MLDRNVLEAAATWYVQLSAAPGNERQRAAWQAWLASDARHAEAWTQVEKLQRQFAVLSPEVALSALAGVRARRRAVGKVLGILLAAGATGAAVFTVEPLSSRMAQYRTGKGERQRLQLADGTQLALNTGSAADVLFTPELREIRLYRGEVLISTASDPRPLRLHTAQGSLRPLGTRFSVSLDDNTTHLSVFEGRVLASCAGSTAQREVAAGGSLSFDGDDFGALLPASPAREAWSRGVLLAEDIELSRFVAELGRYRHGYLGLDPALRHLKIMGTFPLHDTDQALAMLERTLPVRVHRRLPWWVTIEPLERAAG